MSVRQDEPFDVQPQANAAMARALRVCSVAALVTGLVGVLPGSIGAAAAWMAAGIVLLCPLGRVLWLGLRWLSRRDFRFATLAFALLAVVAIGATIAALRR